MADVSEAGFFGGKPWQNPNRPEELCRFMAVWGAAIVPHGANEAAVVKEYTKRDGQRNIKTEVVLALFGKNYERLTMWGDNEVAQTMAKIEKGDKVLAFGKERRYKYRCRTGEVKEGRELTPFFVITQAHVNAIEQLISSQWIQNGLQAEIEADAALPEDEFEQPIYDDAEYENETEFEYAEEDKFEQNPDLEYDVMENPDLPPPPFM